MNSSGVPVRIPTRETIALAPSNAGLRVEGLVMSRETGGRIEDPSDLSLLYTTSVSGGKRQELRGRQLVFV